MTPGKGLLAVCFLLGTTALVHAADPAQQVYIDDAHPFFSITGTVGGVVMDLPDGGGLFLGEGANDPNDLLFGGTVGISAAAGTGDIFGLQSFIGLNLFGTYAYGDFNKTSAFTGPGVVVMQGGAGPEFSTISIGTSSGAVSASASVNSFHTNPQGGGEAAIVTGATAAPGAQDVAYTSNAATGNSFQWGGVQTGVGATGSATAYAALADTNGGVFIAAGNLDGLTLTQDYTTQALYAGGDVTFGVTGQNGTTTLQGYVGPSYRYLQQRNSMNSTLLVDVPEYEGLGEFPLFSMTSNETYTSHYAGGIAGLMATIPASATSAFTIGIEGGAYYTMASMDSDGEYRVWGGSLTDPDGGGPLNPALGPVDLQVVDSEGETYEATTIAFAARGTAAYTMAIAENAQLTFSGSVDYLSAVATAAVNTSISGYDGDDNGTVTYQSGGTNDRIAWGQMINFSGSVSLTGQF
jgi:hypothetical protein